MNEKYVNIYYDHKECVVILNSKLKSMKSMKSIKSMRSIKSMKSIK